MTVFIRFKSTSTTNSSTQKVINQLSALSASRKQPKLLKLSPQDLIKHKTIQNAWSTYQLKQIRQHQHQLKLQYQSIQHAMEELKNLNLELFNAANDIKGVGKGKDGFPLEMRIPTDFPPNKPWVYNYEKN